MNSISSSEYGYQATCGMSDEVSNIIRVKAPLIGLESCKRAHRFATEADWHKGVLALPTATNRALEEMSNSLQRQHLKGVILLPFSMVYDVFSRSYHLFQKRIVLARLSLETRKVENDVLDEILNSLLTSLEMIFKMLVRLGLETPNSLGQQMQGSGYSLLTLARLLEAYESRFAPRGTVHLASQKWLRKEHCSSIARLHFDQIHNLKDHLISAGLRSGEGLPGASVAIEKWLPGAWQALKYHSADTVEHQLFQKFAKELHRTRDELPDLLSATLSATSKN